MSVTTGPVETSERWTPWQRRVRACGRHVTRNVLCCGCFKKPKRNHRPPVSTAQQSEADGMVTEAMAGREGVHIVVEDLGTDNPGFVSEEERDGGGRQVPERPLFHSVSARQGNFVTKRISPLGSMPLPCKACRSSVTNEKGEESKLSVVEMPELGEPFLMPPVINLIPPTPSIVIDEDQFFHIISEEDGEPRSGNSCVAAVGSLPASVTDPLAGVDGRSEDIGSVPIVEQRKDEPTKGYPQTVSGGGDNGTARQGASVEANASERPTKPSFQPNAFQVAPLPQYPRKRSFNAGINLLKFTEQNLDDLNNKETNGHDFQKAELRLLPFSFKMDTHLHLRKTASLRDPVPQKNCSLRDPVLRSHLSHFTSKGTACVLEDHGSPRQRRVTVASYISQAEDQNKDYQREVTRGHCARRLEELSTDELCQWFTAIGLQRCLPFIRGAGLQGSHIAVVDQRILDLLQISTVEDREQLLSAIYQELHPQDTATCTVDFLLETFGSHSVKRFTAALVSMSKSKLSSHTACVASTHLSTFRERQENMCVQTSSHLVELTVHALGQTVNLRTPGECTVGRVVDSCLRSLGLTDSRDLFSLKSREGLTYTYSMDQQIRSLTGSEKRLLELQLVRNEEPMKDETGEPLKEAPQAGSQSKTDEVRKLGQHMDFLQNIVHQVQELHQSLVFFCSELRNMEKEPSVQGQSVDELEKQLEQSKDRWQQSEMAIKALQDQLRHLEANQNRRAEEHFLAKMKLDGQIFKEEVRVIHLSRQVARLQLALQWSQTEAGE